MALLAAGVYGTAARAQVLREEFWVPNGEVRDIAIANGSVYLAGDFTQVGPPIGGFVGLDATTGEVQQPIAGVGGSVRALVSDGAGGWYLGGTFRVVRGLPRTNLAHLDATGNVTSWNPGANDEVLALARDATTGVVFVGGRFTTLGGATRRSVAAVDSNGAVTAWDAGISSGAAHALALSGTTLYAGGSFQSVAGQTRRRVVALDAATAAVGAWNPDADGDVNALALRVTIGFPNTLTVYLGGSFTNVGGQPRARLAAVDGSTAALASWNPGAGGTVNVIALAGGTNPLTNPLRVYVGGAFATAGGVARNRIAELDEGGGVSSWNPSANGTVHTIRTAGSLVYAGGEFTSLGGAPAAYVAAIDRTSGVATNWNPNLGGFVRALAVAGTTVWAGGDFFTAGGVPRHHLAALDLVTGAPTSWDPGADSAAAALEIDGTTLFVGGSFQQAGGQPRSRLAAFDVVSGALTPWNPGANAPVSDLERGPGVVYAAGSFNSVGGLPRTRLAGLDPVTGQATPWNPTPGGLVTTLKWAHPWVYVGGSFTSFAGQTRVGIVRVDAATGALSSWNPNAGNIALTPLSFAADGSNLWVGGGFNVLGGRPRLNLAVLDTTSAFANPWDPYSDRQVYSLAIDGSSVYVGGSFSTLEGQARSGLAALDRTTGLLRPWNPGIAGSTWVLKVHQGQVFAAALGSYLHPRGSFVVIADATTGVATATAPPAQGRVSAWPNPFHSQVALRFTLPAGGDTEVTLHDVTGRLVRRLARGERFAGVQQVAWDGRDESGERVEPGVYFARVTAGTQRMTARVLRVE